MRSRANLLDGSLLVGLECRVWLLFFPVWRTVLSRRASVAVNATVCLRVRVGLPEPALGSPMAICVAVVPLAMYVLTLCLSVPVRL